jgi:SOS-response transcriptional repressor LexA
LRSTTRKKVTAALQSSQLFAVTKNAPTRRCQPNLAGFGVGERCGENLMSIHGFVDVGRMTDLSTVKLPDAQKIQMRHPLGMVHDILRRVERRLLALGISASAAGQMAGAPDAIRNLQRAAKDASRQGITTTTLMKLAPVLRTSVEWLLEGKGPEEPIDEPRAAKIVLLSWVKAGRLEVQDGVYPSDDAPSIAVADLPPGDWFALTVDGDSMDRISPPGSIILVNRRQRQLEANGCFIVADEHFGTTYKRFRVNPRRLEPVSTNPAHEPIFLTEGDPKVIGRVRKTIMDIA